MIRDLKLLDHASSEYRRLHESIIQRTLPLAHHTARRFRGRGQAHDDLVQVASVGLLNAVNRFDPDSGSDFLAFAVPTIMGEVRRHFRDYGWAVKVPRRLKDLNQQLAKARSDLSQTIGRAPTASEIAAHLGVNTPPHLRFPPHRRILSTFAIFVPICDFRSHASDVRRAAVFEPMRASTSRLSDFRVTPRHL